jgi:hypothetical protein
MSAATIYAHRFGAPNDEATGVVGGRETGVLGYWPCSVDIATAWGRELNEAQTPQTRRIALRSAIVMSPDRGWVFDVLSRLARLGFGARSPGARSTCHGFTGTISLQLFSSSLTGTTCRDRSTLPLRTHGRSGISCVNCGVRAGLPATTSRLA